MNLLKGFILQRMGVFLMPFGAVGCFYSTFSSVFESKSGIF